MINIRDYLSMEDFVAVTVMMDAYDLWYLIEDEYSMTRLDDTDVVRGYIQLLSPEELIDVAPEKTDAAKIANSAIVISGCGNIRDANIFDIQLLYRIPSFLNMLYCSSEDEDIDLENNIHTIH